MYIIYILNRLYSTTQNHLVIILLIVWASGIRFRVIDLDSNQ